MIYYIADLHLGHTNIIRHCNRPYTTIEEMDSSLITNWNSRISNNDIVYIVGDMMFRIAIHPEQYLLRLNGKKHLIVGNHDKSWMKLIKLPLWFETVSSMVSINDAGYLITLCHYPMMTWPGSKNAFMVYGHIHNNTDADFWPLIAKSDRMLNEGVDINNFAPVTLAEMIENNNRFKAMNNGDGCVL